MQQWQGSKETRRRETPIPSCFQDGVTREEQMKSPNRRDALKIAAAGGMLGLLGRAGFDAAQAAEVLKVITWGGTYGDAMRACWMDPFATESGIQSEIQLQSSAMETLAALKANKTRNDADLWLSAIAPATLARADGLLEAIPVKDLKNASNLPAEVVNDTYVGVWNLPYGIIYNSETVPFEITKWEDLADERLKGVVSAPYGANYNGLFIALLALLAGGSEKNADPGFELAAKMKPNFSVFTTSDSEQIRLLTSGEVDVVAFAPVANYFSALKSGQKLRFVCPKPYIPVSISNIVIMKGAKVDAAARFIDFVIGKEPQEKIAQMLGCLPINKQAQVAEDMRAVVPADTEFKYMDEAAIAGQLSAWNDRWQKEIQR
jgi:putative spermidine/putrescine transport system substrate-binding protein